MEAAILIPAYEPDEKIRELVFQLKGENLIVIVDDGSGEKYQNLFMELEREGCTVLVHRENQGKGAAIKTGIAWIMMHHPEVKTVVTADCDGQHLASDILKVRDASVSEQVESAHVILGTRDLKGKNVPFRSRFGNGFSSWYFHLATGWQCSDTQTGLRAVPKRWFHLALNTDGTRYDYEMNFLMACASLQKSEGGILKEIPVSTVYEKHGRSHFHALSDSMRIYKTPLKYISVALASAGIDLAAFTVLMHAGIIWMNAMAAVVIARIISGLFNFSLNRRFTFKAAEGNEWIQLLKYAALFITQMTMSGLLVTAAEVFPWSLTLSKAVIDGLLSIASYLVQRRFVFRNDNHDAQRKELSSEL